MSEDATALDSSDSSRAGVVHPTWRMSSALDAAITLGLVIAAVGLLTSRVDVVLISLPFLLSAAITFDRRPFAEARRIVQVTVERISHAASSSEFAYRVAIDAPTRTDLVHLRLTTHGSITHEVILAPVATITGRLRVLHSGRQPVVSFSYRLVGVDGGWLSLPLSADTVERVIAPITSPIASVPLPHRLTGLTGTHSSARLGDGGDFRDLHAYAAGDRLRRIDWKTTARRSQGFGELYVRRNDATSDATLILVIDSREDVGELVEHWSGASTQRAGITSMDLLREAAASLAVAAVAAGDRVGLLDVGAHDGVIIAGSGRRHLDRLLRRISIAKPAGTRYSPRKRAPVVPRGAIVYLLSAFLDDECASLALRWRAAGHRVIAVDVLPTPRIDVIENNTTIAHRLVMAERRRHIAVALASGVEIFRWQEDAQQPSRAAVLRTLARVGRRRR